MGDVPLAFVETVGGVRVSEDDPVAVGKNDVSVNLRVYEALLMCMNRFCLSRSGEHDLALRLCIRTAKAVSIIAAQARSRQCRSAQLDEVHQVIGRLASNNTQGRLSWTHGLRINKQSALRRISALC